MINWTNPCVYTVRGYYGDMPTSYQEYNLAEFIQFAEDYNYGIHGDMRFEARLGNTKVDILSYAPKDEPTEIDMEEYHDPFRV